MATDPDAGPEATATPEAWPIRRPEYRLALPAPRHPQSPGRLAPPSLVIDEGAGSSWISVIDIVVSPEWVYVTLEVPDVREDSIRAEATDRRLSLSAHRRAGLAYNREIELPMPVDPGTLRTTCRNGVLDVAIRRKIGPPRRVAEGDPHV